MCWGDMEQEKVWDAIAEKWAKFRVKPTEEVVKFLDKKKGKVLDLGCGSGRNFVGSEDLKFYGVDFSASLLDIAKTRDGYTELKKGVTYDVPYSDGFFDFVIMVRVLHCVDSKERRRKSLEEVYRVLRDGGEALISVWGRGQGRMKNREKESFVAWTIGEEKFERYTYIYDIDELRDDLESVGFEIVEIEEGENIVAIVRKK